MGREDFFINQRDSASVEELIDAFDVRGTDHETAIRAALGIHNHAFTLHLERGYTPSPFEDAFTFDTKTGALILFDDDPSGLVDALIEMALYLNGFETQMYADEEWHTRFTIGVWHYVRREIKVDLNLTPAPIWRVNSLDPRSVARYDMLSFELVLFLAGCPDLDVAFPDGSSALVVENYLRLIRIMEAVAFGVSSDDAATFNRRLKRATRYIKEAILPLTYPSRFDDLLEEDGFSEEYFLDANEDPDVV
jgi:hypothetical protein